MIEFWVKAVVLAGCIIGLIAWSKAKHRTALWWSLIKCHKEAVKLLLRKGINVNVRDKDGATALMWAENLPDIVNLLLEEGADINAVDKNSATALMWASDNGHTEKVKLLLRKDANVNAKDKDGRTALMDAADGGHTEIVRLLLGKGADVNAKNNMGRTALMYTAKGHKETPAEVMRDIYVANKSLTGADILLTTAAYENGAHTEYITDIETVKLLLEKGADVNARNKWGKTALMYAADEGHTDIVKLLVEKGADVDATGNDGKTAMMWGAWVGSKATVKSWLEKESRNK